MLEKAVLIGSGNVATQLTEVLLEKGIEIIQVWSQRLEHAVKLAVHAKSAATDRLSMINPDADIYIICVKDDAIAEIDAALRLPGKIVVHTSGSADILSISQISGLIGSLYPLQTFTKDRKVDWNQIPICIEATDARVRQDLYEFAGLLSHKVFEIDSATRRKLHLAAVFTNNFTNYMLGMAKEIVGEELPFSILEALARETIEKAFESDPSKVQTGPAIRGDHKTIQAHLKLLQDNPEAREVYEMFTKLISGEK